jgi:leucine dehydrogenase
MGRRPILKIEEIQRAGFERIIHATQSDDNFSCYISIHSTLAGPAFGGVRFWKYNDAVTPLKDVANLSRAMTEKCAVAGIKLGGGKTVIEGVLHRETGNLGVEPKRIIGWLGEAINYLKGDYYAGLDVGFDYSMLQQLRNFTDYTATYSDPNVGSSCTAFGVYHAMKAAVEHKLGKESLKGVKIGIKGLGKVGFQLANYLCDDGAELYFSEVDQNKFQLFSDFTRWKYKIVPTYNLHKEKLDVYSPCALGNDIKLHMVKEMNCKIICGAANNQIDNIALDETVNELDKKNILYIPDSLANVGGVFRSAGTILKARDENESFQLISTTHPRTLKILKYAENYKVTPYEICNQIGKGITGETENRFKLDVGGLGDINFGNNSYTI